MSKIYKLSQLVKKNANGNNNLGRAFGVYELIALNKNGSPRTLYRAKGRDDRGILYIGRSGARRGRTILQRLKEFWKSAGTNNGKYSHCAGEHYQRLRAPNWVPLDCVGVRIWVCNQTTNAKRDTEIKQVEKRRIENYARRHKELPPLNRSWPK